jgi:dTDP-4-dehydrorhamnose reductase
MQIGVTGISGFLGQALATAGQKKGYTISGISWPRTSIIQDHAYIQELLTSLQLDVLINTAVSRYPKTELEKYVNAEFPRQLELIFRAINPQGIFIHISSISVVVNGLQDRYTLTKWQAEKNLLDSEAIIIRPSLIWSWEGKGDAERLEKHLAHKLVALMLYPGNLHLPVLVTDLAEKIIDLIQDNNQHKIINIVGDTPCRVWDLAKLISRQYNTRLIPLPTLPDWFFLPKIVRTINYTQLQYQLLPKPDLVIVLPFKT